MNKITAAWMSNGRGCSIQRLIIAIATVLTACFPWGILQADTLWTPSLKLIGTHDDNIQFVRTEPVDDYVYTMEPSLQLDYKQEVTQIYTKGSVFFRSYQDNDDLNDTIYTYDFKGKADFTERFHLRGSYEFIKDTTLDSELLEIGRIFSREDRMSHNVMMTPSYDVTERMNVGLSGRYRAVAYDSDNKIDYSVWDVNLPVRWRLATEIDTIYISPGYTYRDSDTSISKSYNLRVGWDHETTERLNMNFSVGARYTELEDPDTNETEDTWNGLGNLQLSYNFETGKMILDFQHDLRNTADGNQVNVTRVIARLRWNFAERIGMELNGRYYHIENEGDNNDETTQYYQAGSELFYNLTENHVVFIAYEYSQEHRDDLADDPKAERNRIWAGISLNFPMN